MIGIISDLLIRLALIMLVVSLSFVSDLGIVEFSVFSYYIRTNFTLVISILLIFFLVVYYIFKVVFDIILNKKLQNSKIIEAALLASAINDKMLVNQYSNSIGTANDTVLYLKCKNFLNFGKIENATELIKNCSNLSIKQNILYEILFYYYSLNDLENLGKIIKLIDTYFQEAYWSFKIQIDYFYKIGDLEKVIVLLKHSRVKDWKSDYEPKEFLAYCYLKLAKIYLKDNKIFEAKQILKTVLLPSNSYINIILSEILISIDDKARACSILVNLCNVSLNIDSVNLYKLAGGEILSLFNKGNASGSIMADYFIALDKYRNGAFRDALNYLASNSNNYLVYKLKSMVFLKLDLLDDARNYIEKLLLSKKVWYWECKSCMYISEKYDYECYNCKRFGIIKMIDD